MATALVGVALPVPLFRTFAYGAGDVPPSRLVAGARVVVPVRNRRVIGVVVETGVVPEPGRAYRDVLAAPDDLPAFPPPLLATCRWLADHYAAPLGQVLRGALPAALTGAGTPSPAGRVQRVAVATGALETLMARDAAFRRTPKQRAAWELLESLGGRAPVAHLRRQLGLSAAVLDALVRRGLVRYDAEPVMRDAFASRVPAAAPALRATPAQRDAVAAIVAGAPGSAFLLHGVTGSGKTLVYIDVLRCIVEERGQSAIVLVPEIALTPQTVDRFRAAFGDRVAVLHSALSDGERLDAWRALRSGARRIVVGARSAVFAPLSAVGAIIVDEEQEPSYKQNEAPRYHARDVALARAREEGAVVVLGSATPSLESWHAAALGRVTRLALPDRVGGGRLPAVQVVDRRRPVVSTGPSRPDPFRRVVSEPLERAIGERLARGEQTILLLNRRGYAAFVQCHACGDVVACPYCSISLTMHRAPERLICHYCAHAEPPRERCATCGQATVRERGLGTQQVERLLAERFPAARLARMDVDTTSTKWAHSDILDRVGRREVDILLGTQMIAKGLDFPDVTLVGVVDADVGMNLPDFRASERSFQLLAQVAGRAGRGPKGGDVFIQTHLPDHHAVRCAIAHDYEGFVRQELAERASPPYPPTVRLTNIVFSGSREEGAADLAQRGAAWLGRLLGTRPELDVRLVGPAPCPIERIKARWRWHLLLKATSSRDLTRVGRYFAARFPVEGADLRAIVDRDPVSLL